MSNDTTTPGPWVVEYDGDSGPIVTGFPYGRWGIIALVRTSGADADLIAAAPELRDALAQLVAHNSKHSAGYRVVDEDDIDAARALLARLGVTP